MRTGHSLKPNFLNNAALQRVKVADFPDHWCGSRMKKENYGKQYVTVCDLAPNKSVSLPLSFFLTRVAYLSSFLSFWVKCSSLLFPDYEFIGRASFITNFANRSFKQVLR